jgi:signal transduction histidine kinase
VPVLIGVSFLVWQSSARLGETLAETRRANEALRESSARSSAGGRAHRRVGPQNAALERSQQELADARDEALAASRTKSAFLANMSHELRTPLNAIIGYSEMLREEAEDGGHADLVPDLNKVVAAGQHLLGLINDVLDLSKIEAGRMEVHAERFDLRETVEGIASTIAPLIEKNRNRLVIDLPDAIGTMHSDTTKLRQILFNLLSNASKFTSEGEVRLAVSRRERDGEPWLEFRVADTGIGMTAEQLARIFEPFTQADTTTTRDLAARASAHHHAQLLRDARRRDPRDEPAGTGLGVRGAAPAELRGRRAGAPRRRRQRGDGADGARDRRRRALAELMAPSSPARASGRHGVEWRGGSPAGAGDPPAARHPRRVDAGHGRLERAGRTQGRPRAGGDPGRGGLDHG